MQKCMPKLLNCIAITNNLIPNPISRLILLLTLTVLSSASLLAQVEQELPKVKGGDYRLNIQKVSEGEKITIDGKLDESSWGLADTAGNFFRHFPYSDQYAETRTKVMMLYDDQFLYVAAICKNSRPEDYVVQSLRRDFHFESNDGFALTLDPLHDQLNGFYFAVTPFNVQTEGLISNGANIDNSWDNLWYSAVEQKADHYVVEIAIPFKTLRFKSEVPYWRANFIRNNIVKNEISSWVPVPMNFTFNNLAYSGFMDWSEDIPPTGTNLSVIPYVSGDGFRDYENNQDLDLNGNAGLDLKMAVTPSLTLDLTVNPDFSQADVDRQIINLTRFSLFFPEQRQFFIENSDLFAQSGFSQIRPFFSRNIGLARDENTGTLQPVPIIGGARLSGKLDENWRIGVMNMQTAGRPSIGANPENFTVASVQRQVFERSNIQFTFVNKEDFANYTEPERAFNRIVGLDYNIASADNKVRGKVFFHQSISPDQPFNWETLKGQDATAHASWLQYDDERFYLMWNHEYVGENYYADAGFVPRVENDATLVRKDSSAVGEGGEPAVTLIDTTFRMAFWRLEPKFRYFYYPKDSRIRFHSPRLYLDYYFDENLDLLERWIKAYHKIQFQNRTELRVYYENMYTNLQFPIDITRTGQLPLEIGHYNYNLSRIRYNTDARKLWQLQSSVEYGGFYNGTRSSFNFDASYRFQPWGKLTVFYDFNNLQLQETETNLNLLGVSADVTFTDKFFFNTFFQLNTQTDNINVNTRLQWRFRPMSDLFIVYTDNYFPTFQIRNRALVVKLVYWLNV